MSGQMDSVAHLSSPDFGSPTALLYEGDQQHSAPPAKMSERAREREFYKYYQPFKSAVQTGEAHIGNVLRSADDKALAAFAQLGALRLRARRCMISFFDRKYQYVLAEATRTLSLQTDEAEDPNDALLWGVSELPRGPGICEHTICLPLEFANDGQGQRQEVAVSHFPDLAQDERFRDLPFVCGGRPQTRFYAGVPIRSPEGLNLGSYCIMDDNPRETLTPGEISFLKDMATTVMVHLEMVRAREQIRRNALFVHGLGSFVEGEHTLWSSRRGSSGLSARGQGESRWYDKQYAMQRKSAAFGRAMSGASASTVPSAGTAQATPDHSEDIVPTLGSLNITAPDLPQGDPKPSQDSPMRLDSDPTGLSRTANRQDQMQSLDVQLTFARAANILRECTDVEGVVLYDASVGTFGGMVDSDSDDEAGPPSAATTDEDDPSDQTSSDKSCGIFGFATATRSTLRGDEPLEAQRKMTERLLRRLLKRHSGGAVFSFDDRGLSPPTVDTDDTFPRFEMRGRQNQPLLQSEADVLREAFPAVRSMILVPLKDLNRGRNSAGAVVWTTDPQRVFVKEQALTYLAAFADSVMAEVARIEAKLSEKVKTDFISSVSHELRSPLHGILGSVECLQDMEIEGPEREVLHTVETCGKTLLDTIDHLLDYAKINNFSRPSKGLKPGNKRGTGDSMRAEVLSTKQAPTSRHLRGLEADVDLALLTEEVVETVKAGQGYLQVADRASSPRTTSGQSSRRPSVSDSERSVAILVDIERSALQDWSFRTQPGAWRRIVMNVFGNAIKYTSTGHIHLSLKSSPIVKKVGRSSRSEVIFTVSDTGCGISPEFLKEKLFTPFAQEDYLVQGTGLGLSIIKQIIADMRGTVDVRSVKGKGTTVEVKMKLRHSPSDLKASIRDQLDAGASLDRVPQAEKLEAPTSSPSVDLQAPHTQTRPPLAHQQTIASPSDVDAATLEAKPDVLRPLVDSSTGTTLARPVVSRRPTSTTSKSSKPRVAVKPRHVLLVDDNHINLQLLVTYMKKQGHRYRTATNGLEALQVFQDVTKRKDTSPALANANILNEGFSQDTEPNSFDFCLMDISMPVMDGLESTRRIRAHERNLQAAPEYKPTKILALTGLASTQAQQEAFSSGIDIYMRKPVKLAELTKVMAADDEAP